MITYFLLGMGLEVALLLFQQWHLRTVRVMPADKEFGIERFQSFLYRREVRLFGILIAFLFVTLTVVGLMYLFGGDLFGETREGVFWFLLVGIPALLFITLTRQRYNEAYVWVEDGKLTCHGALFSFTYPLDKLDKAAVLYNSEVSAEQLMVYVKGRRLFAMVNGDRHFEDMMKLMEQYGYIKD